MPDVLDVAYLIGDGGTDAVGSPLWWLRTLNRKLENERPLITKCDDYYEGRQPVAFATSKFREAFGDLFGEWSDNWCEVVVDAAAERLRIDGFRVGDNDDADDVIAGAWSRNHLGAKSGTAMLEAVKLGRAAVIVDTTGDEVRVTVEHPSQVYVECDPSDRTNRLAALKKWRDVDGTLYATVYLPDATYRFRSKRPEATITGLAAEWIVRDDVWSVVPNALGVVPVIPIENNPSLLLGGRSDLKKVIPVQDAVNKLVLDMIVASEFAAFRQRLLTGVEIPRYPEGHAQAGEPMNENFISAVSRLLVVEEPDARAQEFGATDLSNYVKAIELLVQHLAAQTRTPPHYLIGSMVNASGDALKAAETGLVAKCRRKHDDMGVGWTEVARLILKAEGDPRADDVIEPIWGDPENRSVGEQVDAGLKEKELGVPLTAIWARRLGAKPNEVARWEKALMDGEARAMLLAFAGTGPGDQGLPAEVDTAAADATPPNGG